MWDQLTPKPGISSVTQTEDEDGTPLTSTRVEKLACPKEGCPSQFNTRDHLLRHVKGHGIFKGPPQYPKLQPATCNPKVLGLYEQNWGPESEEEEDYDPRKLPEVNEEGNK